MQFTKATKKKSRLRAAVFGPSGSGKTKSCLRIADGMKGAGTVGVIDTERGSASKYSDAHDFLTLQPEVGEKADIDWMIAAIGAAAAQGIHVLIIDSLSHAWQELLVEVDKLARTEFRGNSWSAWSKGTPKQHRFINAILDYPGHVLATMRSKTEWEQIKDERSGKITPKRVGLSPEQGKGIEYEFDVLIEIGDDHTARIIKDRSGKFQDQIIEKPGEDFGNALASWLDQGVEMAPKSPAEFSGDGTEKRATSGEIVNKIPDWSDDQKKEVGGIFQEIIELGGETAEKQIKEMRAKRKYDPPADVIDAAAALLHEWRDIAATPAPKKA